MTVWPTARPGYHRQERRDGRHQRFARPCPPLQLPLWPRHCLCAPFVCRLFAVAPPLPSLLSALCSLLSALCAMRSTLCNKQDRKRQDLSCSVAGLFRPRPLPVARAFAARTSPPRRAFRCPPPGFKDAKHSPLAMGVRDDLKIGIVQRNIDSELKKVWRTLPFHSPFTALSLPFHCRAWRVGHCLP